MKKNINSKTKKGIVWDLSGSLVRQIVVLFISTILARLLDPVDFGIIGMSMVFITIAQAFTDVGFTSGLIQQKETKDITFSSVFYINVGISILVSLIIIISAPLIASFYDEPRVLNILYLLAIIPPISSLGRVQAAILTKRIDFKSLTIRDFTATLVGGTIGVIAAYSDYGVYSLVIQQIIMVFVGTIMLWFATGWRPKLEFSILEIKNLFKFSSYVFLDGLMRQIFLKIDTLFVGKIFSPTILGFYSRAESLKSQVQTYTTNSLNKVIFPVLSQLQDNEDDFKKTYFRAFNIITGLVVTLIGPVYFLSHYIIIFLFGEKWEPSVLLFQILLLSIFTGPQGALMGQGILAKGYSKLRFNIGLIQRLFKLTPIILGLFYGIEIFTLGMVISSVLVLLLFFIIYQKVFNYSFFRQFKNFLIPNVVFISFVISHYMFPNILQNWVFALVFLFIHCFYLISIKHESFLFVKVTLKDLKTNSK